MLARIAYELYWIGRYLARAEHTARMLDGAFRVNLQARAEDAGGGALSWAALLAIMDTGGTGDADQDPALGARAARVLTLEEANPTSIVSCVDRAREAARTVRDVLSTETWEVVNTFRLYLRETDLDAALQSGPYSIYALVKERCALFWGLAAETMLRDEAAAFLDAGRHIESASMVLRMLRVATAGAGDPASAAPSPGGEAFALLHAVGAVEAYRRSVTAPPDAFPVAAFLLYERCYPHSVAAAIEVLHDSLRTADVNFRTSPPALRLGRLAADLEFRRRAGAPRELPAVLAHTQAELAQADHGIEERYFAGAARLRQVVTT